MNVFRRDPTADWLSAFRIIATLAALLWCVEFANHALGHALNAFGIYPRAPESLPGVLIWPMLHVGFPHLIMNTTPLLVLGFFVALRGLKTFVVTSLIITVFAGLLVWLVGREAYHVGASGLVFGYFGFLVAVGVYEKSLVSLGIASFAIFYYGGLIYGVLPGERFISWEAHLFGLLGGVLAAWLITRRRQRRRGQRRLFQSR